MEITVEEVKRRRSEYRAATGAEEMDMVRELVRCIQSVYVPKLDPLQPSSEFVYFFVTRARIVYLDRYLMTVLEHYIHE